MRWKDLLWVFAYPIYQVIGTFRHESGHAIAAILFGGRIKEFVFLPTKGYWGYVSWVGPHNLLTAGAPYLLDLLTFLIFFSVCMRLRFRRRWVWLNLVILGVLSPLINSAYNCHQDPDRVNDVTVLLRDGNAIMVTAYFILTLSLYIAGLYILFTRAKIHDRQPAVGRVWTTVPLILGSLLFLSACTAASATIIASEVPPAIPTPTTASYPSPEINSATMTPTISPEEAYDAIFKQVVALVAQEYPQRAPIAELTWEGDYRMGSGDPETVDGEFSAGDWNFRLFDWNRDDLSDPVDVYVINKTSFFNWSGTATLEQIDGQLNSAGLVPKPAADTDEWLVYTNEHYGYRFEYPSTVDVIEHGVDWIESDDVPEGMEPWEAKQEFARKLGPNLCVQVVFGDSFIWFNPPENFGARFNFCQYLGPNAPGWQSPERSEVVTIDGRDYVFEGRELIKIDGSDHDEALRVELSSGMHIQVGATTDSDQEYQRYREEALPVLLQILETYQSMPRGESPES
jgi:hypothetical protein